MNKPKDGTSSNTPHHFNQASPAQTAGSSAGLKRILVVDNEPTITWLLQEGLAESTNCEVLIASNGMEALSLLETNTFDLIITDHKMPGMNGLTLAGRARPLQPDAIIIMLTGYGNERLYEQAVQAGIHQVLNKPVKLSEIRSLVTGLLNR